MGTLAQAAAVLGLLAGYIIARLAKEEVKPGTKYFKILQHAILAAILGVIVWNYNQIAAIIGALALLSILWRMSWKHPLLPTAALLGALTAQYPIEILTFLYFIPTATVYNKNKTIILTATMFILGLAVSKLF
ncbi:MAG TPA: hypothetical protein VI612_00905 [Candidatus Nanoarchaeia archaeon]|nr:hypothetical protein [Candidatus Nanoarchaeia archaeon]